MFLSYLVLSVYLLNTFCFASMMRLAEVSRLYAEDCELVTRIVLNSQQQMFVDSSKRLFSRLADLAWKAGHI